MSCLVKLPPLRSCFQLILVASLFFGMTAFKTYPLIVHWGTHIPGAPGDNLLIVWIMAWGVHALSTDPWNLFNANIFYPASNTLALSEHMLGVLPIFAPAYAMTGNPILAYNTVYLLSFTLCGMTMFLLVRYWTQDYWAALVAGFLFAFAPIRLEDYGHIQLSNLYWAPLAFLWLEKFLRSTLWKDLAGFSIFYWLQVLSSIYLGWFTTVAIALYVLTRVLCDMWKLINRTMVFRFATFVTLSILILLPIHFPYYQLKRQWGIQQSLQHSIYYSSDLLLSYITVPDFMNDLYFLLFRRGSTSFLFGRVLFPGLVTLLLVVVGILVGRGATHNSRLNDMRRSYWVILISSILLSLGPYLVILGKDTDIPLPYLLLYYLAPGFQAMRVPARFGFMMVLAASVLAAYGFLRLCQALKHIGTVRKLPVRACDAVMAFSCLALFTLELGCKPLPLTQMPVGLEVPPVYRWLAAEKPGPVVELPEGPWDSFRYQYFSTYHWLPLVNGTSGYNLPTRGLIDKLQPIPSQEAVMSLSSIGAKVVVVHYDQVPFYEALQWHEAAVALGLEQVARFGADLVYSLPSVDSTHDLKIKLLIPDRLPIASSIRVGLLVQGASADPRGRDPGSSREEPVIVEWVEQSTGQTLLAEKSLEWTLASDTMRPTLLGVSVDTPPAPGRYMLTLRLPAFDRKTVPHSVELTRDAFMTSANAPQMLSAGYFWEGPQPQLVTSQPIPMGVRAINTGQATWLAHPKDLRGTTALEWRWFKGDQEISRLGGREPLVYDVFPGQAFTFRTKIIPPAEPGEYRLEFQLVGDSMTRFAAQGESPLQHFIRVLHLARSNLDLWLAEQSQGLADPLPLTLSAERRRLRHGEMLNLMVVLNTAIPAHRQIADASLMLVWPDGRAFVLGKGGFAPYTPGLLDPLLRGIKLPKFGGAFAVLPLPLQFAGMPYGPYAVHFVLTEPDTVKVIGKAEALFSLEP